MMILLTADISTHCPNISSTQAERAIARLPSKSAILAASSINPARGIGFYDPESIRNRQSWWPLDQEVNVVAGPVDVDWFASQFTHNPAKVGP